MKKKENFKIKSLHHIDIPSNNLVKSNFNKRNSKQIPKINQIKEFNVKKKVKNISTKDKLITNSYKNEVMELATKYVNNAGQQRRYKNQIKLKNGWINSTQNLHEIKDFKNFQKKNSEVNKFKLIQKVNQQTYNNLKLENERLNNCIYGLKNTLEDLIGENTNLTEKNDKLFSRMRENKIIYEDIINDIKNTTENEILNNEYSFKFKDKSFENKFNELLRSITKLNVDILNHKLKSKKINLNSKNFNIYNELRNNDLFDDKFDYKEDKNSELSKSDSEEIDDFNIKNIENKINLIFDLCKEKKLIDKNVNSKNLLKKLKLINNFIKI